MPGQGPPIDFIASGLSKEKKKKSRGVLRVRRGKRKGVRSVKRSLDHLWSTARGCAVVEVENRTCDWGG